MSEQEKVKPDEHTQSETSELSGRIIGDGSVVQIGKDMVWPRIVEGNDIEWIMRYADDGLLLEKRFYAAQIIAAYRALISMPQNRRNLICKAIQDSA